ncbi:hypothetical protein H2200_001127 [Cladophialophora chaetospira]|uniref:non-specific serine/threonine protein kinase n=1 Tax=Cladophialophora chaetospira TaxID=386627 RepID=A0AA39CMS1_9EURO|nr:hypothetical protein H2200_001127 [Cladophialophora chaetospira]
MTAEHKERQPLDGKALQPLAPSLSCPDRIEQGTRQREVIDSSPWSPKPKGGNLVTRVRYRASPFFSGFRREKKQSIPSPPSTAKKSPTVSADNVRSQPADSASKSFPRTDPSDVSPTPLGKRARSRALPTVVRPRGASSSNEAELAGPPPLPLKSPLRLVGFYSADPPPVPPRSPLRPAGLPLEPKSASAAQNSALNLALDSNESERSALRLALSPAPLHIRKTRRTTSEPTQLTNQFTETQASSACQFLFQDPSRGPQEADLTVRLWAAHDTEVAAHRRKTLETLEGRPHAVGAGPHPQRLCAITTLKASTRRRRRPGGKQTMNSLHPDSAAAMTAHRREAVRLAQEQQKAVAEKCKRSKQPEPDYTFDELIGKGSFGRVYKGRQLSTSKVVAIKVLDIDEADFHAFGESKDEQIRDFNREIRILRQAQESGAQNLNQMIEALPVHSQLWMVCEYCPGGSVKTLMRATKDRLAEKYIIIVARELAKALKGLHEAGIIHRDVKAANVLIHQEGRLELCDFGVASILDTQTDKRKTFIGTLHWMPPELWTENPEYSDEVDVWEYGCTIYECAMGKPPNADLRERQQLKMRMRRMKQAISLPEDDEGFSEGLRSLVSYTLTPDAATRPSMKDVLEHKLLKDTDETHPTSMLTELVQTYYAWLFQGGQRVSLFMPGGAAAASAQGSEADGDLDDEWNFSMTQDFEKRVSAVLEIPDFSDLAPNETLEGEETPKGLGRTGELSPPKEMTAAQKANFESRVKRGADLSNIFDQNKPVYEYKTKTDFIPVPEQRRISDLPFRAMAEDRPSSIASVAIDLGDFDEEDYAVAAAPPKAEDKIQTAFAGAPMREETIRLADASTLREKRANSKGPRDPSNPFLTARRASSAEEVPPSTAHRDFAMPQDEWTVKNKPKAPELQEPAEITSSRAGHATMDWSFASAMSEAVVDIPQINVPDEEPKEDAPGPSDEERPTAAELEQKARKHATMEWSFSTAMAEAKSVEDELPTTDSSPPRTTTTQQKPLPASRPTPTRPAPLMRQMTMPVTMQDFNTAEEQEIPRPSTALSEAYSDISASSTDIDPFGLERDDINGDHPGPATMDEDVNMGQFYSGRGRTMFSGRSSGGTTPLTANGPGPAPYAMGRPARIGEDGFPGPNHAHPVSMANAHRASNSSVLSSATAIPLNGMRSPLVAFVPIASPPSMGAMAANASNEDVEAELTRLLEGMHGTLNAAREVVGGLERRRGGDDEEEEGEEWISDEDSLR